METVSNRPLQLLNEHAVAELLGVSIATVRRWRLLRQGPKFIRVGAASVRYRPEDLKAYIDQCPAFAGAVSMGNGRCRPDLGGR
jgi:predicted DNA-binding transcriptional regulator AlpA